ncbi:heme NO-binding domain-containing protein [Acetobacter conturbans]|uniref:Heme NO-binding protein n=1 Tax=Acetobacter conturbans TaxID=1737472 RepID=A0ABX0K0M2_9PROT|nr:heme NO-binding domain-containing protein [Acetobacter conturbans]NHN87294.1 heme NO-binding protein [Acetobacter conturbans]
MKGVVFNLLEDAISGCYGAETWDILLDETGLDGVYSSLGDYPDGDIQAIVTAAAARLGVPEQDVLRWFGETAMPLLKSFYPELFAPFHSSKAFVLSVNTIIHPEVMKLYSGACCPYFRFQDESDEAVRMTYRSSRKLLDLAHGFVIGAAGEWNEKVSVERFPAGSPQENDMIIRWLDT